MNCEICDTKMPAINTRAQRICGSCENLFKGNKKTRIPNAVFFVIGLLLLILIIFSIKNGFI
jgi:hypothetical protein